MSLGSDRDIDSGTAGVEPLADLGARSAQPGAHARAVREMFDRISPTYDTLNRTLSFGIDAAWRRRAVRELLASLPAGDVLDLCAGTMDLAAEICRQDPSRAVHAVDFSAEMLARGASKVDPSRVTARVGDAAALPLTDASLAGIVAGFGIRNVADTARAVTEARRVLVPGGRFVTLEFFRPTRAVTRVFHRTYNRGVLPWVGGAVSGERGAYAYLARSMEGFMARAEYEALLAAHGFERVRGRDLLFGVASLVIAEVPAGAL